MCGPSVQKAVRRLWKKQSFSFFIYIHVNDCIIRRRLFTLSFHENWVVNCFSVTWYGEGKRRNEFSEWHAAWLAEWHNYVECNICRMTQRKKLNWKVRPFLAPINLQTQKATTAHCRLAFSAQPQRFFFPLLVGLHGSTDTTTRKSAIFEENMFWKVTLPSTLIFSAKMFARLTLQFLFTYICICNGVSSSDLSCFGLEKK